MHPGPINRGVEIAHDLADRRPSVILDQVRNGVAVRMAVLYLFAGASADRRQAACVAGERPARALQEPDREKGDEAAGGSGSGAGACSTPRRDATRSPTC